MFKFQDGQKDVHVMKIDPVVHWFLMAGGRSPTVVTILTILKLIQRSSPIK